MLKSLNMTTLPSSVAAEVDLRGISITGGIVGAEDAQKVARVFKALSDPTRVRLLSLIAANSDGEVCLCELTEPVGLSQPTVSHHMKLLVDAGLVTRDQRGRWAYYAIDAQAFTELREVLDLDEN